MKRFLLILVAIVLIGGLVLIGCAAPAPAPAATSGQTQGKQFTLRMDGGPAGSDKNFSQETVGQAIRMSNPTWRVQLITGPTTTAQYGMMLRNEMDFMWASYYDMTDAKESNWAGMKMPQPLNLAWIYPYSGRHIYMLAFERVPFNSISEMIQKKYPMKLAVGRKGSAPYYASELLLKAYGTSMKDMESWGVKIFNGSTAEFEQWMSDEIAEGWLFQTSDPSPVVNRLTVNKKLKIICASEPDIQAKVNKLGLSLGVFKAGTYPFVTKDMPSVMNQTMHVVRRDMPDDVAYNLAKGNWENREYIIKIFPSIQENYTQEKIQQCYKEFGDWIHPGAKKYFSEQGIIK